MARTGPHLTQHWLGHGHRSSSLIGGDSHMLVSYWSARDHLEDQDLWPDKSINIHLLSKLRRIFSIVEMEKIADKD